MWQRQLFERQTGSGYGVLWGVASDGANVYAANGSESKTRPEVAGGMAAVAVRDGTRDVADAGAPVPRPEAL